LDNGASRANASVSYIDTSALALGPDGALFGWDVYDGFHTLELGGTGTTVAQTPLGVVLGSDNDAQIVYDPDDFVYASSGEVVDVTDPNAPKRNGVFPFSGAVWPMPSSDLVLMVSAGEDGSGPLILRALDTATSTQIEARSLGNPTDAFDFVSNLGVIPPDTVAFIAGSSGDRGSSIYLFHDPNLLARSPPSATSVLPVDRAGLAELAIDGQALVADPSTQRIYVSVGDRDPVYPNRLVTIDAVQPAVVASVPVGSRPTTLALSDDGSTLWVNLHGSDELCKVNIGNGTATPSRKDRLPFGYTGSLADATSMIVLSGTTSSLMTALALGEPGSVSFLGLKVVDDGTARPGVIYNEQISRVIRGPQGYVFGYDDMTTKEAFYTLVVDGSGAVVKYQGGPFVTGFGTDIVYDSDGYVYASSGEIVEVSNPEAPTSAGAFGYTGAVWPVPSSDDVLMVSIASEGNLVLRKLDTVTQMQLSATAIGDPNATYTSVSHVVHGAPGVLAFIAQPTSSAQSRLYVLSDPDLVP
jgi:hypothetical protein